LVPSGTLNKSSATLLNCSLGVPPNPLALASANCLGSDLTSSNTSIISFSFALASLPSNTLTNLSVSLGVVSLASVTVSGVLVSAICLAVSESILVVAALSPISPS